MSELMNVINENHWFKGESCVVFMKYLKHFLLCKIIFYTFNFYWVYLDLKIFEKSIITQTPRFF